MWLVWTNFERWSKDQRQRGTKHGESNKELHNRKHTVYNLPRKKAKVEEEIEDEAGAVVTIKRDWNTRDYRALEDDIKDIKRQKRELAEGRRIQWTDITASISPRVQAAVELEPTYKEVEV
jgi:flagellar biosynthesis chaperone FliJ